MIFNDDKRQKHHRKAPPYPILLFPERCIEVNEDSSILSAALQKLLIVRMDFSNV